MSLHRLAVDALLALVVLSCWTGVLGMLRMPHPTQALHYMTLPATIGAFALLLAVLLESGFHAAFFKMLLISLFLLAINSIVTHATARAFRTRELGHWEPRDGDPIQFIHTPPTEKHRS